MIQRLRRPADVRSLAFARRGSSLIEMVVAIGVASVVLTTALTVTHLLLNTERNVTKGILYSANVTRLSRALRADVNAAEKVEMTPTDVEHGQRLTLSSGAGPLAVYEIEKNVVSRVASARGAEERDQFRFPEASEIRIEQEGTPNRVNFVLTLAPRSATSRTANTKKNSEGQPGQTFRIEATVARNARFVSQK